MDNTNSIGDFDLIGIAQKVIEDIDNIRSVSNEKSTDSQFHGYYNESRVNAFFRMIGLPMFVNVKPEKEKGTIINTGYKSYLDSEIIENTTEIENIFELLSFRENKLIEMEIKNDQKKSDNIAKSLRYMIPLKANFFGSFSPNIKSSSPDLNRDVCKFLFPLIPYYKKINPTNRNVARPFETNINVYRDDVLRRPFLETVIFIRSIFGKFSSNSKDKNDYQKILAAIKTEDNFSKIYKQVESLQGSGVESFILKKIFESLNSIAKKYITICKQQAFLSNAGGSFTVSLKTESSKDTFGKKVSSVASGTFSDNSEIGIRLKNLKQKRSVESSYLLLLTGDSSTDLPLNETSNSTNSFLSSAFVNLLTQNLKKIDEQIREVEDKYLQLSVKAETLRVEVDLITGEFSGISIIDVIAVISSLFMIEERHLYALLDKESKENMFEKPVFKDLKNVYNSTQTSEFSDALEAVVELQYNIEFIYNYVNWIINAMKNRELKDNLKNNPNRK